MDTTKRELGREDATLTQFEEEVAREIWGLLPYNSSCPHCGAEIYFEDIVPEPSDKEIGEYIAEWKELVRSVINLIRSRSEN